MDMRYERALKSQFLLTSFFFHLCYAVWGRNIWNRNLIFEERNEQKSYLKNVRAYH